MKRFDRPLFACVNYHFPLKNIGDEIKCQAIFSCCYVFFLTVLLIKLNNQNCKKRKKKKKKAREKRREAIDDV